MFRGLMDALIGNMHAEPGLHVHELEGAAPLETRGIGGLSSRFINLREFINRRCPSLIESFKPAWWLPNGHFQTFYCVIGNFSEIDKVVYDRKYFRLKDGGTIGLDFTPSTNDMRTHPEDTPVIVVMHGLTGGSHESYVRSILAPACTPIEKGGLGYRAVVVNFRGCAGTPITSPQFYSAYHTDDLRQALIYLSTLYPRAPFLGLGFSLGANVLVRYLGEEGANSRLKSGCALGCPWNLWKNNIKLEDGWFYQNVYSRSLGGNLVRAFTKHRQVLQQWPDNPVTKAVMEVTSLKKTPLIGQFDQIATRFAGGALAPHGPFPFPSGHDYYVAASSDQLLHSVGVPLLAVNAGDDPVVRALPEDAGKNPLVALMTTRGGGHLGWFTGTGLFGIKRWIVAPVLEWLAATSDNLVDSERSLPRVYTDGEGWITEEGREHLGLKLAEGMDTVVGVEGQEGLLQGL